MIYMYIQVYPLHRVGLDKSFRVCYCTQHSQSEGEQGDMITAFVSVDPYPMLHVHGDVEARFMPTATTVGFSDGTLIKIGRDDTDHWFITPLIVGRGSVASVEQRASETPFSDKFTLGGGYEPIRWVITGESYVLMSQKALQPSLV